MRTALIVLNYNDFENTKNYVNIMENYHIIDKIIVVDNCSTKKNELEQLNTLKNGKVEIIVSDHNGGYAYGNNIGLQYIESNKEKSYDIVIISNPDISIEEINLSEAIEYIMTQDKVAICAPRMYFTNGAARRSAWKTRSILVDIANSTRLTQLLLYPIFKSGEYSAKDFEKEILSVDAIAGSFFIAKYNIFKEIGFFDEKTFLFYEEDILGEKIIKAGYEIHSLNTLSFIHYDSQTIGKVMNIFKKIDILFDSKIYYHKIYHKANWFQLLLFYILKYERKLELLIELPIRKLLKNKEE